MSGDEIAISDSTLEQATPVSPLPPLSFRRQFFQTLPPKHVDYHVTLPTADRKAIHDNTQQQILSQPRCTFNYSALY